MDFITYNLEWYKKRLDYYVRLQEKGNALKETVHEAKVLHKFLEDINDEGYCDTYDLFQNRLQATQTLETFISSNRDSPFLLIKKAPVYNELSYKHNEIPLQQYLDSISESPERASLLLKIKSNSFYEKIHSFSRWVYESIPPDTAVIFLLRDTLLPYLAFNKWNKDNTKLAIPLLIGRKFLFQFGNGDLIYNSICDAVYTALYDTENTPYMFQDSSEEQIRIAVEDNELLSDAIIKILSDIQSPNIFVVETGVHGTMPLLLRVFDNRIKHIMLYTTLPWFYSAWGQSLYTRNYEELRLFETLNCQDLMFSFSSLKDDGFYIKEIDDNTIFNESLAELNYWKQIICASEYA
ncbi:MAG: hypothetical protein FWE83_02965 [Oscillospiraceae bacterium]|nr:hypothetical protein [Oscillospiraceae bacterium]